MNQQQMENYLQRYKGILKKVKTEVAILHSKQEELIRIAANIRSIKDIAAQLLSMFKSVPQQQPQHTQHIHSLSKVMNVEHKIGVWSLLELSDMRIAVGDYDGRISLFTVNLANEQWKLSVEHKAHTDSISSLCELRGSNTLVSGSYDNTLNVWKLTSSNSALSLTATLPILETPASTPVPSFSRRPLLIL